MTADQGAVRKSWSNGELQNAARQYMLTQYGIPGDLVDQEEKDRWRERLGLLVDFVNLLWG